MGNHSDTINKEQNDAFTGQSATKESADPRNLEKRWYEIQNEYISKNAGLTNDDVSVKDGKFDEMVDRVARKMGRNPKNVREEIENW